MLLLYDNSPWRFVKISSLPNFQGLLHFVDCTSERGGDQLRQAFNAAKGLNGGKITSLEERTRPIQKLMGLTLDVLKLYRVKPSATNVRPGTSSAVLEFGLGTPPLASVP